VVQTDPAALEIRIKAKQKLDAEKVNHITRIIRHHLNLDVDIAITYPEELATTSRGKLRPVFVAMQEGKQNRVDREEVVTSKRH
jgi:hypothetical protein